MENHKLLEQINQAIAGLLWLSEIDYPWQVVCLPEDVSDLTSQTLLRHYEYPLDSKIAVTTLDSFFASAMVEQEWYNEAEIAEAQRYQNLYNLLQDKLTEIKVYLVGEIEIDVYLLGKTENNNLIVLSTKMVAT